MEQVLRELTQKGKKEDVRPVEAKSGDMERIQGYCLPLRGENSLSLIYDIQ